MMPVPPCGMISVPPCGMISVLPCGLILPPPAFAAERRPGSAKMQSHLQN